MKIRMFLLLATVLAQPSNSYIEYKAADRPLWMIYSPKTVYPRHKQKPYTKKIHLANLQAQNSKTIRLG